MKRTRPCEAAKAHLEAGHPIYYCEDAYPDEMIREWPDGRRELVTVTANGEVRRVQPYQVTHTCTASADVFIVGELEGSSAVDMSLRDTVWTDHGQGMHNAARCARPAHSLTTLAHSSHVDTRRQSPPQLNINTPRKPKPRPATAAIHYLEAAQPAVE